MNSKATDRNLLKKNLEIVIIDDDPLTALLQKTKIRVRFSQPLHVFEDAREALDYMTGATATDFLVLLDINMPAMDGWEFLAEWQKAGANVAIKVFMLSCSISRVDKERSLNHAEVVDYFEKPLSNTHLEAMEKLVNL